MSLGKILVVDDERNLVAVMQMGLRGCRVRGRHCL